MSLEFATTDEIMAELVRRSDAVMIALIPKTDGDEDNPEKNCISQCDGGAAQLSWMAVVLMAYATRAVDVGRETQDEEYEPLGEEPVE